MKGLQLSEQDMCQQVLKSVEAFNGLMVKASIALKSQLMSNENIVKIYFNLLPQYIRPIIDNCTSFLECYQQNPQNFDPENLAEMVHHLLSNMNNWAPTRDLKLKFNSDYNFLHLARLIKAILKAIANNSSSHEVELLNIDINVINNHIADDCLAKGKFQDAEAYWMRSLQNTMPHSEQLMAHVKLAQLKATELGRSLLLNPEFLPTIEYNLQQVNQILKTQQLDDSCAKGIFFLKICRDLSAISQLLQQKSTVYFKQQQAPFLNCTKLLSEIHLRLKTFQDSEAYKQYVNQHKSDYTINMVFVQAKQKLEEGLNASLLSYKKFQQLQISQAKTLTKSVKTPQLKRKKISKEAVVKKIPQLSNNITSASSKPETKPRVEKLFQPSIETDVVSDLSSSVDKVVLPTTVQACTFFESGSLQSKPLEMILPQAKEDITKVAVLQENDSDLVSSRPSKKQPVKKISQHPSTLAKTSLQPKLDLSLKLYPLSSAYLPNKSLAGILPPSLENQLANDEANKFREIIERGKIVGRYGKGIKLVTEEERKKRKLPASYIYKLKDPSLDARIFGREATLQELKELKIEGVEAYKKVIIFDRLVDSHKLQAQQSQLLKSNSLSI